MFGVLAECLFEIALQFHSEYPLFLYKLFLYLSANLLDVFFLLVYPFLQLLNLSREGPLYLSYSIFVPLAQLSNRSFVQLVGLSYPILSDYPHLLCLHIFLSYLLLQPNSPLSPLVLSFQVVVFYT